MYIIPHNFWWSGIQESLSWITLPQDVSCDCSQIVTRGLTEARGSTSKGYPHVAVVRGLQFITSGLSIELSTTWQLASPTVNNWRKGKRDRQTDKHTKREATVSFYKFGSNLLSLLPYWSHRPTIDLLVTQTNSGTMEEGTLKGSTRRQGSLRTSWVTGYHSNRINRGRGDWVLLILLEPLEHPCFVWINKCLSILKFWAVFLVLCYQKVLD